MNRTNIEHAAYALLMQLPFGLAGWWWRARLSASPSFSAALKQLRDSEDEPSDAELIAQLKREAAAVTCAAENPYGQVSGWAF